MNNIHPIFKDALSPFMRHMALDPAKADAVKAKAQRNRERAQELAKLLPMFTDTSVPFTHREIESLARDIVEELNDIDERWRVEVWGRL